MNQEWQNLIQGNTESFEGIYTTYYKPLFRYGLKICQDKELVKECLHILFCELWEKRPHLRADIKNPKYYLFTWFKRIILKNLVQEGVNVESISDLLTEDSIEAQHIEIEEVLETQHKLDLALAKLTKKQRRYIQLRFFENKSYEEISRQEGAPVRTVYNVIYEALKSLKANFVYQAILIFIFSK